MYYSNIGEDNVKIYHNMIKSNFNILLTDIFNNRLFNVESIIENKLYRIYPLFYCDTIVSTNPNDVIIENQCIICEYNSNTVLNFNSNAINDFDYNYELRFVDDVIFYDFIFYDKITLSRLNNVEMTAQYLNMDNEVLLSENFVSNHNGVIIFKPQRFPNSYRVVLTFKFNNIVKTMRW